MHSARVSEVTREQERMTRGKNCIGLMKGKQEKWWGGQREREQQALSEPLKLFVYSGRGCEAECRYRILFVEIQWRHFKSFKVLSDVSRVFMGFTRQPYSAYPRWKIRRTFISSSGTHTHTHLMMKGHLLLVCRTIHINNISTLSPTTASSLSTHNMETASAQQHSRTPTGHQGHNSP